ncbi:hypothetical protein C8Q80DRAFT_1114088 [Daedaleopsis nitida]|nr:hypothetical protein C8Q80DRAFT_1114088 [Daedaleopsis nitida]
MTKNGRTDSPPHTTTASAEVARLKGELDQAKRERERMESEQRKTLELLETRTAELKEAQEFLTKVDAVSATEVQNVVRHLNSEIFQTANRIADSPQFRYDLAESGAATEAQRRLKTLGYLEPSFISSLHSVDHTQDSVLLTTALQACMTAYAEWLASSWDRDGRADELLDEIYQRMRKRERQSVAARWRVLSRAHVGKSRDSEVRRHAQGLQKEITYVLLASGVVGNVSTVRRAIQDGFGTALGDIINIALEFQRVAGERIVSCDMVLAKTDLNVLFDADAMEDEWADPKRGASAEAGHVVCTTQVGLTKEEATPEGVRSTVLVKPKVVLDVILHNVLHDGVNMV